MFVTAPVPGSPETSPEKLFRYDLSDEELRGTSEGLFSQKQPSVSEGFVCYKFEGSSPFANIGRTLEQRIFEEAFPNETHDKELFEREYGPYDSASTFLVSFDAKTKEPVGVIRYIKNSSAGLKTMNDVTQIAAEQGITLNEEILKKTYGIASIDNVWDIGTVGVLKTARSARMAVSGQLYRALYVSIMDKNDGVVHGISVIDSKTLGQLKEHMGLPMKPLLGMHPFEYLGSSKSETTYSRPDEYAKAVRKKLALSRCGAAALGVLPGDWSRKTSKQLNMLIGILDAFINGKNIDGVIDADLQFPVNIR